MTPIGLQVLVLLRTARARAGMSGCLAAQVAAGALAAGIPSALQAQPGGAGLGLGFSFGCAGGFWLSCLTGPVVLALLAQRDGPDGRARYLSGWRRPNYFAAALIATATSVLASVVLAGGAGAMVGLGDALRHGSSPFTGLQALDFPWAVLLTSISLAAALVAWGCTATTTTISVVGGWALFVALLPPTSGGAGRTLLALTPFAPSWAQIYPRGSFRLTLQADQDQLLIVALLWSIAVVAVVISGLARPLPPS